MNADKAISEKCSYPRQSGSLSAQSALKKIV